MEKPGDQITAYCNLCTGERAHKVLFSEQREWHDDDDGYVSYHEVSQSIVAACCGCEYRTFLTRWWNSSEVFVTQYPPKTLRRKPDWGFNSFTFSIADATKSELLNEVYSALGAGCPRLAVMGVRALLEHIMIEKVGDQHGFAKNLSAFTEQGFISKLQGETLSRVLEAGHASIHRAYKPELEDVLFCLDVTELLIASIYIHPTRSARMNLPVRAPRTKIGQQ
jgi:hypothetical protein